MVFWRKKKNAAQHEEEARAEKLLHPKGEPALELPTEYDAELDEKTRHDIEDETMDDLKRSPVPEHTRSED